MEGIEVTNPADIHAYRLHPGKVDLAYPLVRELAGHLTIDDWRSYVRRFLHPADETGMPRGIFVAEMGRALRGLASYEVIADIAGHSIVSARDVVVFGPHSERRLARRLLQHLFAVAEAHTCRTVRVDLAPEMRWLAEEWSDPDGAVLRYPVICFVAPSATRTPTPHKRQTRLPPAPCTLPIRSL